MAWARFATVVKISTMRVVLARVARYYFINTEARERGRFRLNFISGTVIPFTS